MPELPFPDRRTTGDRRSRPTHPLSVDSLKGRRRQARRIEDRQTHFYVDRYGWRGVLAISVILALSLTDATFTLRLVTIGAAREINPLMDYFISLGPVVFLLAKYLLTGGCMVVFLVLKNYRLFGSRVTVKELIWLVLIGYATLITYELWLISRL